MSKVYRNVKEIPIPERAHVNNNDGRVYIFFFPDRPTRDNKKITIGMLASPGMMHPNDNFKRYYPALWNEYYGSNEETPCDLSCGMYALTLAMVHRNGLYQLLQDCYGPVYADAILDYSMYSILDEKDTVMQMQEKMRRRAVFSQDRHSDTWFSELFAGIRAEQNRLFLSGWMNHCKQAGTAKAWIGIDGSNNDCASKNCDLAEKGHDKSGNGRNIVGYMYAVNSETGLPITYTVYNGGKVDSKAFKEVIKLLSDHEIGVSGVIVDRGFCASGIEKELNALGYPFVMMVTSDTDGYAAMVERHASEIRMKTMFGVAEKSIFGVCDKVKLFKTSENETTIALFYDGVNGSDRSNHLYRKVFRERARLNKLIIENRNEPDEEKRKKVEVSQGLAKYISLEGSGVDISVVVDHDKWQADMDSKGYYAIATSEDFDAKEIDRVYNLRDASEKQYMIMKSHLGFSAYHAHTRTRIESKHMAAFVSSIIRSEIADACRKLDLDTTLMLTKLDRVRLSYNFNSHIYTPIDDMSNDTARLLAAFGIKYENLSVIAREIDSRSKGPGVTYVRKFPEVVTAKNKGGRPRKDTTQAAEATTKSNGKKTAKKQEEPAVKRKPGRPAGSKDSKPRKTRSDAGKKKGSKTQ